MKDITTSPSKLFVRGTSLGILYNKESAKLLEGQRVVTFLTHTVSRKSPSLSVSRIIIWRSLNAGTVVELTLSKNSCGLLWKVSLPQDRNSAIKNSKNKLLVMYITFDSSKITVPA